MYCTYVLYYRSKEPVHVLLHMTAILRQTLQGCPLFRHESQKHAICIFFRPGDSKSDNKPALNSVKKKRSFAPGTGQRPSREGLLWTCGHARRSSSSCSTPHYRDLGFHSLT
jgi:hypothetical protein